MSSPVAVFGNPTSGFSTSVEDILSDYEQPYKEEDLAALGVDPLQPTAARPGSSDKVVMLAARYAAGLPLWHQSDCHDHGPGNNGLLDAFELD